MLGYTIQHGQNKKYNFTFEGKMGKTIKSNDLQSKTKYIKKRKNSDKENDYIKKYNKNGYKSNRVWPTNSEQHKHKGPKI